MLTAAINGGNDPIHIKNLAYKLLINTPFRNNELIWLRHICPKTYKPFILNPLSKITFGIPIKTHL